MEVGIDSFASVRTSENGETADATQSVAELLERIEQADRSGLDIFGIGEHHRHEFLDSANAVILAAAAARTERIRLTSAVTVLSAADPVRVFQQFATLDLISIGVGGTPQSFLRAGMLGLPLVVAIIGGETHRFRSLVDLYRDAGAHAGYAPETLKVSLHSIGYVADTTEQAVEEFFPGYAETFTKIGRERGWPPVTRAAFDAQRGATGALLVGSPEEVAEKIRRHSESLGGISRVTFQMDNAQMNHAQLMRSIELIGMQMSPLLND